MTDKNQLTSPRERLNTVRTLLEKMKAQLQMALPKHITADRLIRVAITAVQRTPKLLECDQVSLLGAIVQSAQLGLEPDGVLGQAYLIPFWNGKRGVFEVQFMPGYKGLLELARRSGTVETVEARVVRDGDRFKYAFGLHPALIHEPKVGNSESEAIAFYAIAGLKSGARQFDVMDRTEVDGIRERSRAKDNGPWVTDYDEMGKKTVLRRLCKLLPASIELQKAVALDELADRGVPQDLNIIDIGDVPVVGDDAPKGKLDTLTDELAQEPPQAAAAPGQGRGRPQGPRAAATTSQAAAAPDEPLTSADIPF